MQQYRRCERNLEWVHRILFLCPLIFAFIETTGRTDGRTDGCQAQRIRGKSLHFRKIAVLRVVFRIVSLHSDHRYSSLTFSAFHCFFRPSTSGLLIAKYLVLGTAESHAQN